MTRKEFLTALDQYLVTLSAEEKADIISDYEEHFRVGLENGKTEAEIAASLGSPYDVANQFLEGKTPQMPSHTTQQSYQQSQNYNNQQNYSQSQNYNNQQNYAQSQNYGNQQSYGQSQNYGTQGQNTAPGGVNSDGYVYENTNSGYYNKPNSQYNTTGIIVVVVLCVVLIPTLGSAIVSILLGIYGSVLGFGAAGVALITAGSALVTTLNIWLSVGLILLGVASLALMGLLIMASVEGTKLFIKLIKFCIKECKKMITEGSF